MDAPPPDGGLVGAGLTVGTFSGSASATVKRVGVVPVASGLVARNLTSPLKPERKMVRMIRKMISLRFIAIL